MNAELLERLDRITAILALAHRGVIAAVREEIRADALSSAILDSSAGDWTPAATLRTKVLKAIGAGKSTYQFRLAELVACGAVHQRGESRATEYRSSGLI